MVVFVSVADVRLTDHITVKTQKMVVVVYWQAPGSAGGPVHGSAVSVPGAGLESACRIF